MSAVEAEAGHRGDKAGFTIRRALPMLTFDQGALTPRLTPIFLGRRFGAAFCGLRSDSCPTGPVGEANLRWPFDSEIPLKEVGAVSFSGNQLLHEKIE